MPNFESHGLTLGASATSDTEITVGDDTKGAWAELAASTGIDAKTIVIGIIGNALSGGEWLIDLGIGASGSEVVLIPNILHSQSVIHPEYYCFECDIPSGTRISARAERTGGTTSLRGAILISDTRIPELSTYAYTTHGQELGSDPIAVTIDPGSTVHTKGAYIELASSVAADCRVIALKMGHDGTNLNRTDALWAIDLAKGAAGSEVIVVPDLWFKGDATGDALPTNPVVLPGSDFQSQRLSIRARCSITQATDRLFNCVLTTWEGAAA